MNRATTSCKPLRYLPWSCEWSFPHIWHPTCRAGNIIPWTVFQLWPDTAQTSQVATPVRKLLVHGSPQHSFRVLQYLELRKACHTGGSKEALMLLCSWQSLEPVPKQMQPGDSVHVSLLWHLPPDVFSLAQAPWSCGHSPVVDALTQMQLDKNPNVFESSWGAKIPGSYGYGIIVLVAMGKARCREA